MAEISEEEVVNIANNFLLSSPPGEFLEVAIDVRALLRDESILNASAPDTFREYNTEQMMSVKSPHNTHDVLICKAAEVGDGEFVDHRGKQVVLFDHIRQQVTGTRPLQAHDVVQELEPLRASLEEQFGPYATEYYPLGALGVYSTKGDDGKLTCTVCLSAARFQGANFNNGRWRSSWQCQVERGQVKLTGMVKIHVHYYEDGNVQLTTDLTKSLTVPDKGNPAATASEVLKAVQKVEADFQVALESSYGHMSDTTFKALRRVLPITRTKIDWEKILKYKLGVDAVGAGAARGGPGQS